MKIKITGTHQNGHPYVGYFPKESITHMEAEALLLSFDPSQINSISDGSPVDHSTLQMEIIDDRVVPEVDMPRFQAVLYLHGIIDEVNADMEAQNGIVKIFWKTAKSISYYHPLFQASMQRLGYEESVVKGYFFEAQDIE